MFKNMTLMSLLFFTSCNKISNQHLDATHKGGPSDMEIDAVLALTDTEIAATIDELITDHEIEAAAEAVTTNSMGSSHSTTPVFRNVNSPINLVDLVVDNNLDPIKDLLTSIISDDSQILQLVIENQQNQIQQIILALITLSNNLDSRVDVDAQTKSSINILIYTVKKQFIVAALTHPSLHSSKIVILTLLIDRANHNILHVLTIKNESSTLLEAAIEWFHTNNLTIDVLNQNNATPLQYAISVGNKEAVRILLAHGANLNLSDHNALADAVRAQDSNTYREIIDMISSRPEYNNRNIANIFASLTLTSIIEAKPQFLRYLQYRSIDLSKLINSQGDTLLHTCAAQYRGPLNDGQKTILSILLPIGTRYGNNIGLTPIGLAQGETLQIMQAYEARQFAMLMNGHGE